MSERQTPYHVGLARANPNLPTAPALLTSGPRPDPSANAPNSYWLIPRDYDGVVLNALYMETTRGELGPPTRYDLLRAAAHYLRHDIDTDRVEIYDNSHARPEFRKLLAVAWKPDHPYGASSGVQTHITQAGLTMSGEGA